jgi:hypothetical protein
LRRAGGREPLARLLLLVGRPELPAAGFVDRYSRTLSPAKLHDAPK